MKHTNNQSTLLAACENFIGGWSHFCDCIDFDKSALDAEAIRFMNEVPGQIALAKAAAKNHENHFNKGKRR